MRRPSPKFHDGRDILHWSKENTIAYTLVYEGEGTQYNGVIGVREDIVLAGRESDWAQESHSIIGPNLRAMHRYNCVDFNGFLLPNTSCSSGWKTDTSSSYRRNYLTSFGVYHSDNTLYWYDYRYDWEHPEFPGQWSLKYPPANYTLTSNKFECKPGTSPVCHFLEPESPAGDAWEIVPNP